MIVSAFDSCLTKTYIDCIMDQQLNTAWKVDLSRMRHHSSFLLVIAICSCQICSCQEVSLRLRSDDVVFEGVSISLVCSVSSSDRNDNIDMEIRDESGQIFFSGPTDVESVYAEVTAQFNVGSLRQTYFCEVDWTKRSFEDIVRLVVDPVPVVSPYCYSNYDNGVIAGETVRLVCYHPSEGFGVLSWRTDSSVTFTELNGVVWVDVQRDEINIQPTMNQNGSIFHCDSSTGGTFLGTCSIGPIYIFQSYSLYIEPGAPDGSIALSSGQSQNYTRASLPSRETQWVEQGQIPTSVGVTSSGSVLSVEVLADNTFFGDVAFLCSLAGTSNDMVSPVTLTLAISTAPTTAEPRVTAPTTTGPRVTATSTAGPRVTTMETLPSGLPEYSIIIVLVGVTGLLILIAVVLVIIYVYYRCRRKAKSFVDSDQQKTIQPEDREYAVPPFGFEDTNGKASTFVGDDGNEGRESYTMVDKSDLRVNPSGALAPPSHDEHEFQGHGQVNGGFTSTTEFNEHESYQQETSPPNSDRVSVVYAVADSVKKSRGGGVTAPPLEGLGKTYATVNKSRHVHIDDSVLDDDTDDGFDDYENP